MTPDRCRRHASPRAAKSGCAAAIRGFTAPTSPTCAPRPATSCSVRSPRGRTLGLGAVQRSSRRSRCACSTYGEAPADEALVRRRIEAAIAFRESLAIDATAYRLVHGEADLLPSLDRRSLRRLPGGAGAVAGHGPAAAGRRVATLTDLLQPRGILARNDPRARAARRAGAARRRARRRGARDRRRSPRTASTTTSICAAGRRPGCFSISARTAPRPRAVRARPAARLLQLQRRLRARAGPALPRDDRVRRLGGRGRARAGRTPRATASPSTPASATCSTSCAASIASASGSTPSCSIRRRSRRTRPRSPTRAPATRRSTCAR